MKKDLFSLTALSSIHFPTYPIPLKPQNNFNLILQLDKGHWANKVQDVFRMKVERKSAESYVLFDKFQLHMTEGNTQHELTRIYKGAYKDPNNKKTYSQFAISWQAWGHSKLFSTTLVKWLGGELKWDTLSKQERQSKRWYDWPQQVLSLCSCFSAPCRS